MLDKYIHGSSPTKNDLSFTYFVGLFGGVSVLFFYLNYNLAWWQLLILFLIAADIFGGVIANISLSTNEFYYKNRKLQVIFLLVHIVHILALVYAFGLNLFSHLIFFLYLFFASVIVITLHKKDFQKHVAISFVIFGIFLSTIYLQTFLAWFYPIFMLKLIYGFSVKQSQK